MAGERTIKIKFDGNATGLGKASKDGERSLSRWARAAERVEQRLSRLDFTKTFGKGFGKALNTASALLGTFAKNAMNTVAGLSSSIASSIGTAVTSGAATTAATGGLNLLVGAVLALAGAAAAAAAGFVVLAPAVLLAGGAFGAAMTAAVGLGATMAVLKFGLSGVGTALGEIGKEGKVSDETLKKLSPNARLLVKEFERLKKPFDNIRRFVQDKLLVSMNLEVRALAKRWLPALKPMLGDLASRFNLFGKRVFIALGRPDFIKNIRTAVAGFGDFIDRIGLAIPGLIGAFGRLAKASVPFLREIGDMIGGVLEKFSAWITAADKSGKLDNFMKDAAKALRDIWNIGGLVFGIVGDIIKIFFPGSQRASGDFLGGVTVFLEKIRAWLADPVNQKKIQDFVDKIQDFVDKAAKEWIPKVVEWLTKIDGWVIKVEGWGKKITDVKDRITGAWDELKRNTEEKWNGIVAFFAGLPGRITGFLSSLPGRVAGILGQMATRAAYIVGLMIGTVIGAFIAFPGNAARAVASLPGKVAAIFTQTRTSAVSIATSLPGRVASALAPLPGRVADVIGSIPGRAAKVLAGIGGVLRSAGRALIDGLIQGIKDKVPSLEGTLNWVTSKIPDWKGPESTDKKLLVPAGKGIMGGLMQGIDSEVPALRTQLQGLTTAIGGMGSRSGVTASASSAPASSSPALGGDTYVYVTIDGQQLEGRIDSVVRRSNRGVKRRVLAGSGAGR